MPNGKRVSDYRQVVRVWRRNHQSSDTYLGTAFLISPKFLLTAKHVVEGIPANELILKTSLASWSGGGDRRVRNKEENPNWDAAVLELEKIAPNADVIPIATELEATLEKGTSVSLIGYSTEVADQENVSACISGYRSDYNLEMTDSRIDKGMSGCPALLNNKLVAITIAKDDAHSYLLPVNSIRQFIQTYISAQSIFANMQPIRMDELNELKLILGSITIPEPELAKWLSVILPDSLRPVGEHLTHYLDFLSQKIHNETQAPLFEFIHFVKPKLDGDTLSRLDTWVANCCHRMGLVTQIISSRTVDKIHRHNESHTNNTPIVLLKVEEENRMSEGVFFVNGWMLINGNFEPIPIKGNSNSELTSPPEVKKCSLAELGNTLYEISRDAISEYKADANKMIIEILLPLCLMNWNPSNIPVKVGPLVRTLGERYGLIIRSWDRYYDPDYCDTYSYACDKWQLSLTDFQSTTIEKIFCGDRGLCCDQLLDILQSSQQIVFVAKFPCATVDEPMRIMMGSAIAAGTPFMLWSSSGVDSNRVHDLGHDFREWPERTKHLRGNNNEESKEAWRDIRLMWDNPERCPPDFDKPHSS